VTLGQICNRIDAAKQRGEFNPLLPVAALFPELVPITEGKQQTFNLPKGGNL
jgi:hypothetical protein